MMMSDQRMHISIRWFLISIAILCFILLPLGSNARAESIPITLTLNLPNEGETFYAGPSSLLYNIPIEGQVSSSEHEPGDIKVHIEILQDSQVVASQDVTPGENGIFRIYGQVNPGAAVENFAAEFIPCGDRCHVHPSDSFSRHEWDASFALPPGKMIISITATDPEGNIVTLERKIIVDRSKVVDVPVRVVFITSSDLPKAGIPISASTWLYMWRSRIFSGGTDSEGNAILQVEVLSERSTNYRFQVKPTVLNGILYESVSPVDITLEPDSSFIPKVTLVIKASLASIHGKINGNQVPAGLMIWAIPEDKGEALNTLVRDDGSFEFANISINKYLLTADNEYLANLGYEMADQEIDLATNTNPNIELNINKTTGFTCMGTVLDEADNPIPFTYGLLEGKSIPIVSKPDSGEFTVYSASEKKSSYIVNAPGYFSQVKVITPGTESCSDIQFNLKLKPESREIDWGNGKIVIPDESKISQGETTIFLERGWLWGRNDTPDSIILQPGTVRIRLENGRFAIQELPGLTSLFVLLEGNGAIQRTPSSAWIPIEPGSLILLGEGIDESVIPIESTLISRYFSTNSSPITTMYEPTFMAAVISRLALLGIDAAKIITFVTYVLILLSIILLPIIMLFHWRKDQKHQKEE